MRLERAIVEARAIRKLIGWFVSDIKPMGGCCAILAPAAPIHHNRLNFPTRFPGQGKLTPVLGQIVLSAGNFSVSRLFISSKFICFRFRRERRREMNANAISDLCALSTLGRQLNMCAGSQNIDVSSVLLLNDVDLQCDKLLVLIDECIKANDKDSSASNHTTLSETLTTLNEIAARSSNEFLTKHDRLEDLRLWITILKVLCDSFAFLKTMNAEERQYLEAFYGALDRMRGFDFIKNIRNAMEITEDMPPGFKFPVVVVEK